MTDNGRSRSFRVTDFGTHRKPMCDFLVNRQYVSELSQLIGYRFEQVVHVFNFFVWGTEP